MADATINVVDRYGEHVTIPLTEFARAQAEGYRVATGDEVVEKQRAEKYDQPLAAFGEGVARGATFGLSDIGATDAMAARKQYNPIAAGAGAVTGGVAGLGFTGIGGLAARAGEAVAAGGTGLLARAASAAVRGGIEGAALGTGAGVSDLLLSKDPLTAEAIAGTLGHDILVGGLTGGAGGAALTVAGAGLGAAVRGASKVVQKTAAKLHAELAEDVLPAIPGEPVALAKPALEAARKVEASSLEAVRAEQGTALAKDIETFRYDVRADLMKLKQELPKGTGLWAEAIAPEKALHKVIGDLKTLAEEPTLALSPLRRLEQQVAKIGERLPDGTVKPILDRLSSLQDRISDLAGDVTSPRLEALEAHLEALASGPAKTPTIDAMTKTAGAAAGGAIGGAMGGHVGAAAGAWLGKEIGGAVLKPLMKKVLGVFADHAGAIDDGAAKLLAKLTPPAPALNALRQLATAAGVEGENDYEKATNAVQQAAANPEQTRERIRQELAGLAAISPQLAQAVGQQLELKLTFLSSKVPPALTMGITGRVIPPSDSDRATFARYVAAANDPLRLLQELRAGTLMPETVETHQALYPGITARTQAALTEQLADPKVASKLSYPMRLQLGMLLGPQVDPTLDPGFIAMLQAPFAAPPPKPSPPAGGRAQAEPPTSAQRLTSQ